MAAKVVDASALAALLFGEPEAEAVAERLRGADIVGPTLLPYELTNVCWKKRRLHPSMAAAALDGLQRFGRLRSRLHEVDHQEVLILAEETGLTAYDASYLWLARRLGAELVTLDGKLEEAARGR